MKINKLYYSIFLGFAAIMLMSPGIGAAISSVEIKGTPDKSQVYDGKKIEVNWKGDASDKGYSFVLDKNGATAALQSPNTTGTSMVFQNLDSGSWFFHIASVASGNIWSETKHYPLKVDNTAAKVVKVFSKEVSDKDKWYNNGSFTVQWQAEDKDSAIVGYSYQLNDVKNFVPGDTVTGKDLSMQYANMADGIWYFHVKALNEAGLWSEPEHFQIKIDTTAPKEPLKTARAKDAQKQELASGVWTNKANPAFDWDAVKEEGSGVAGYRVYFGTQADGDPQDRVDQPGYTSKATESDKVYYLRVKVLDNAGNESAVKEMFVYKYDNVAPVMAEMGAAGYLSIEKKEQITSDAWTNKSSAPYFEWEKAQEKTGSGVKGYEVYFGKDSKSEPKEFTKDVFYKVVGVKSDEVNYLIVRAVDEAGNKSVAKELFVYKFDNIPPQFPDKPAKAWSGDVKKIELQNDKWTNVTDRPSFEWEKVEEKSGSGVDAYLVYLGTDPKADPQDTTSVPQWSAKSVKSDDVNYLIVKVKDRAGNISKAKEMFVYKFDNIPPAALLGPARFFKNAKKLIEIKDEYPNNKSAQPYAEWVPVDDKSGSKLKGYLLAWTQKETPEDKDFVSVLDISMLMPRDVTSNSKYYLFLKAVDNAQNMSAPTRLFTYLYDIQPPSAPKRVDALAVPLTKVVLSWGGNEEGDLAGYEVYRTSITGEGYEKISKELLTKEQLNYQDLSVQVGKSYYYVIKAVDKAGNLSDVSLETSAPNVEVEKEFEIFHDWDSEKTPVSGAKIKYKITYRNTGFAPAKNIAMVDAIPNGTVLVPNTIGGSAKSMVQYWDDGYNKRSGGWVDKLAANLSDIRRIRWHIMDSADPVKKKDQVSGFISYIVRIGY